MRMWRPERAAHGPLPVTDKDIPALNRLFADAFTDRYRRDGLVGVRVPYLNEAIWRYAITDAGGGAMLWRDAGDPPSRSSGAAWRSSPRPLRSLGASCCGLAKRQVHCVCVLVTEPYSDVTTRRCREIWDPRRADNHRAEMRWAARTGTFGGKGHTCRC